LKKESNFLSALKRQRSQVLSRQFSRQISLDQGTETEHEKKCKTSKLIDEELVETGQVLHSIDNLQNSRWFTISV
jgi:hypothetical protein